MMQCKPLQDKGMSQRIATLDFVRGLAILGILLLNITAFGAPKAAYLNPAYLGQVSLHDAWTWAILSLLAQAKFLMIFAILFGGGLQLLLPRGKGWIQARLSWLLLFGAIHAIFLWDGDILLSYGLVGLICWRLLPEGQHSHHLCATGILLYLVGVTMLLVLGWITSPQPDSYWLPDTALLQYEQFWKLKGGIEAIQNRLNLLSSTLVVIAVQYGWELAGAMLLGAGLMRNGWLRGNFAPAHYRRTALCLLLLAFAIQIPALTAQWQLGWEYRWSGFWLQAPRELASLLQAIGYLALCYGFWPLIARWRVSAGIILIGRMALSNYLLQTLLCTLFFNQLGFWGRFDRLQLLLLVPPVWAINFLFSRWWLQHFPQGPLEWLWRKLTTIASGLRVTS